MSALRTRSRGRAVAISLVALACAAGLSGCEDPPRMGAPPAAPRPPAARASANADAGADGTSAPMAMQTTSADFTENDRTRDPFRSFAREFVPVGPETIVNEGDIKLREYALDDLRLVAVVVGTNVPYAMVIDPSGRGTLIRRGDYVGRPDTVTSGPEGSMPHQVPWRVVRVVASSVRRDRDNLIERPGEVILEREDRLNPTQRAEHVLSLAPGEAANRPAAAGGGLPPLPSGAAGLPYLPPVPGGAPGAPGPPGAAGGTTYTQSYTTVVPPQPAQAAPPTTVVIQTGPQGQTSVTGASPSANGTYSNPSAGGTNAPSNQPPPVQINSGPTYAPPSLPSSGLPR